MDNQTSKELKQCPFCSEVPTITGKLGRFRLVHSCGAVTSNTGLGQRFDLIKAWNTRSQKNTITDLENTIKSQTNECAEKCSKIAELEKDISIAAKIMIDITKSQKVTDNGYGVGYLATIKIMNRVDAFISKVSTNQNNES
jgi:hypothetical protein